LPQDDTCFTQRGKNGFPQSESLRGFCASGASEASYRLKMFNTDIHH